MVVNTFSSSLGGDSIAHNPSPAEQIPRAEILNSNLDSYFLHVQGGLAKFIGHGKIIGNFFENLRHHLINRLHQWKLLRSRSFISSE